MPCVQLLMHYGANPNLIDTHHLSPLDLALHYHKILLLDVSADINFDFCKWVTRTLFRPNVINTVRVRVAKLLIVHMAKMKPMGLCIRHENVEYICYTVKSISDTISQRVQEKLLKCER